MTDINTAATASGKTVEGGKGIWARNGKGLTIGVIAGGALAIIGIVCWGVQLSGGMIQTGMRNFDSWGLYITSFMFFVGLSAGGLIISSIPNAFGIEGFGGISKVAIWTSICSTVAAVGFIIVDLGGPARIWELFAFSNLMSPLMWDVIVITTYFILSCVYLWAYLRHEADKMSHLAIRVISVVALVCAVLVHSVTAWIFGLNAGREMWHTALLAPWFVSSALVCGTALVLIVVIALRRVGYLSVEERHVVKMAKLLGAFTCVDLYFFACDLLTGAFPGGAGLEVAQMIVAGPLAPFFWFEVVGCAVAIVICFAPKLRTAPMLVVAGALAIAGVFCKRVQILEGGFQIPNIDYPGVMTEHTITNAGGTLMQAYQGLVYLPTGLEIAISIGVVGLAFALLCAGLKWLPLKPVED